MKTDTQATTTALASRLSLTMAVDTEVLLEQLSLQLDTPEKFCQFLAGLDAQYQSYDFTLAAAQFFVKEIRDDHKAGGEKFSYTELFGA